MFELSFKVFGLARALLALGMMGFVGRLIAGEITVKGSDTLVVLAQRWAETYMAGHPEVRIQVTGGGTGTGFAALQSRTTDICTASRRMKARELETCIRTFRKRPTEFPVAMDGLSVFVNPSNPIRELSLEDLMEVFTGRLTNWKDLGGPDAPITLYSRESSSGTYEFFKDRVLQGRDFSPATQTLQGTAQVIQAVGRDRYGIGYGGAAYGSGAKTLWIAPTRGAVAVEPNEKTVHSGEYPVSRYLYCYVNPSTDRAEVADYLAWIRGPEGQSLVRDVGYYPLPMRRD